MPTADKFVEMPNDASFIGLNLGCSKLNCQRFVSLGGNLSRSIFKKYT